MASTRASISKASKRPKINIIPPKQLFIDLTNEDTITPSPKIQESSPSAPYAPFKTPSTKDTSSSSINYTPKSPTLSSSPSTNGYLNPPLSPPPRVPQPLPKLKHQSKINGNKPSHFSTLHSHLMFITTHHHFLHLSLDIRFLGIYSKHMVFMPLLYPQPNPHF
ncbi:hypothetical protein Tco_1135402 [Tanacetum coccineum]